MSNPLTNLLPAAVRRDVYAVVAVASAAFSIWQATGGNWVAFAAGLVGSLTSALAHGNVPVPSGVVAAAVEVKPVVDAIAKDAPAVIADVQSVADAVAAKAPAKKSAAPAKKAAPAAKKAAAPAKTTLPAAKK